MSMIEPILMEMDQEANATRRLLERIPAEHLGWRPHAKARSLGELAVHIAETQKAVSSMIQTPSHEVDMSPENVPANPQQIVDLFEESLESAKTMLRAMSDDDLMSNWTLTKDGQPIFNAPKLGMVRMIVLNHVYHHRGQLSAYLRQLGVALPSIYGPSADENPFG
jgi:uncharacterized damage-inducible protein DinB